MHGGQEGISKEQHLGRSLQERGRGAGAHLWEGRSSRGKPRSRGWRQAHARCVLRTAGRQVPEKEGEQVRDESGSERHLRLEGRNCLSPRWTNCERSRLAGEGREFSVGQFSPSPIKQERLIPEGFEGLNNSPQVTQAVVRGKIQTCVCQP